MIWLTLFFYDQDINEVCTRLPRTPQNAKLIRVIRKFRLGMNEIGVKAFSVRREVVLKALRWLKQYNVLYKEIEIVEDNLNWIEDGVEQSLPCIDIIEESPEQEIAASNDLGPSISQVTDVLETEEYHEEVCGTAMKNTDECQFSKESGEVCKTIEDALKSTLNKPVMPWPYVSPEPVSEYDEDANLFPKAFPWLFPGGTGDFFQYREEALTASNWIKRMVLYVDGRFAKDKMWGFFALNFASRRKNQNDGAFFVNQFFKEGQKSLKELKDEIQKGNTKWIDHITYFSSRVTGCAGYWRDKRAKVYSWIHHHAQSGHGAPNFFITLSCAEYFWKDIKRLIEERFMIAGLPLPDLDKNWVQIVNDYTLVVQEYFQERVKLWLSTVGEVIFRIKHHWLRYEFAPSRGQVHVHMLAISDFKNIFQQYSKMKGNRCMQAEFLRLWVEETLGMTCNVPEEFSSNFVKCKEKHAAGTYFREAENEEQDGYMCLMDMQQHECSGYCLRKRKSW